MYGWFVFSMNRCNIMHLEIVRAMTRPCGGCVGKSLLSMWLLHHYLVIMFRVNIWSWVFSRRFSGFSFGVTGLSLGLANSIMKFES